MIKSLKMADNQNKELSINLAHNNDSNSSVARMRWNLLAKVFQEGRVPYCEDCPESWSVRRFSSFGLISMSPITDETNGNNKEKWFLCSCKGLHPLRLKIRLHSGFLTSDELKGFDNTGNVCIWPSEEVLTFYCIKNREMFSDKSVCELGGGMTGLSGLAIAITAGAKEVFVTDGNIRCVENMESIIGRNQNRFADTLVVSRHLRWNYDADLSDLNERFDYVICADCLYYDDGRQALVETIWRLLNDNGQALLLAPTRGKTFKNFMDLAKNLFEVEYFMSYDIDIWELNCQLKQKEPNIYVEDLHYPQMLFLRKK